MQQAEIGDDEEDLWFKAAYNLEQVAGLDTLRYGYETVQSILAKAVDASAQL